MEMEEVVVRPSHYARYLIEPVTFIMRNGFEFWRGNIVKYASRAGHKLYPGKDEVESRSSTFRRSSGTPRCGSTSYREKRSFDLRPP